MPINRLETSQLLEDIVEDRAGNLLPKLKTARDFQQEESQCLKNECGCLSENFDHIPGAIKTANQFY